MPDPTPPDPGPDAPVSDPSPPDPTPPDPGPAAAHAAAAPRPVRWPAPPAPASPRVLAAAALTGLVAAVCVPPGGPGVGWLVTGVVGVAALALVARPAVDLDRPARAARAAWAAATVALLAVGALRAAGWLFALCVPTAIVTGSLALTRGAGVAALARRAVALPVGALRAPRWVAAGVRAVRSARAGRGGGTRLAATGAVTVALLVVFGGLLVSADAAFARLVERATPDVGSIVEAHRVPAFVVAAAVLLGAAATLVAPPDPTGLGRPPARRVRRLEWAVPVGALVALFAAFVSVQVPVLFGGDEHVLGAGGPTYAQHARSGFWQLLAVTVLTLAVIGAAARWAPREARLDRALVRALLGALAALTLVIVASALLRMHVYQQAYGSTRLRLLVSLCELWLGAVLVLVLAAGVRLRARWLPTAATAAAVATLLGLALADPDRAIAERNVARYAETERIDVEYLSGLSADAVPALDGLPRPLRDCALARIADDVDGGWSAWTLGGARARAVLDEAPASCAQPRRR